MLTADVQVPELKKEITLLDYLKKIKMIRELQGIPNEDAIEGCINSYIDRSSIASDSEKKEAIDFIKSRKNLTDLSLS